MSDFWSSDLGEITGKAEDAFAKSFKQIPDNTLALAKVESFTNQEYKDTGFKYLEVVWVLTDGDFKGQKVTQKLKVFGGDSYDKDPAKTRHRALNMLALMYQLFKVKRSHTGAPTDQDLGSFVGKPAGIKIRETEPNNEGKQYNWVAEIHSPIGFKSETGISIVVTSKPTTQNRQDDLFDNAFSRNPQGGDPGVSGLDDDIPF